MAEARKVLITCAVTGAIHTPSMSPHLPVTPEEIADAAIGAAEAGAAIVHLHARDPKDGRPQVTAGHALRRADGTVVGALAPHTIQPTSIGALTRLIQIPLAGTAAGDYELVLTVRDEVAGEEREVVEPFSITASAGASAAR